MTRLGIGRAGDVAEQAAHRVVVGQLVVAEGDDDQAAGRTRCVAARSAAGRRCPGRPSAGRRRRAAVGSAARRANTAAKISWDCSASSSAARDAASRRWATSCSGPSGRRRGQRIARAPQHRAPPSTESANVRISDVLPAPGSPLTTTMPPRPWRACAQRSSSVGQLLGAFEQRHSVDGSDDPARPGIGSTSPSALWCRADPFGDAFPMSTPFAPAHHGSHSGARCAARTARSTIP